MKFNKSAIIIGLIILACAAGYYFYFNKIQKPSVNVYFTKEDKLVSIKRDLPEKEDPLKIAAFELMKGPDDDEAKAGLTSEIPKKAKIIKIDKKHTVAIVAFNDEIENYGGGSLRVQLLVAQIVYTFTEIQGISKVKILVDDREEVALGGEGFVIDRPLSRDDVKL